MKSPPGVIPGPSESRPGAQLRRLPVATPKQLPRFEAKQGVSVFVSYSRADEPVKTDLLKHLEPLRRQQMIHAWHDQEIRPGDDWKRAISKNLELAQIVLLLVSIDFINSKYCYEVEVETALKRHRQGLAVVIPTIARNCLWKHTPIGSLQALPKDGKAISTWQDRDDALTNVAEGVHSIVESILSGNPTK